MPTKCSVFHCNNPSFAKDLCQKHYKRQLRHGSLEQTRPDDWGAREKHPAYKAWCGLRRYHRLDMDPSWVDDFWAFAKTVPEKTSDNSKAFRIDKSKPWSVENFYWRDPILDPQKKREKREYQREWSKHAREKNKNYFKDSDLRRTYGVDLKWYDAQCASQKGLCAICNEPEKVMIRGKPFRLAIDHNHQTGAIRGLLCSPCNRAIGLLKDDPATIRRAADYLESRTSAPDKNRA